MIIDMDIVIIGHNEGDSVQSMLSALQNSDGKIIYVADRCTDNTIEQLSEHPNVEVIDTTEMRFNGRKTSTLRNLGLSRCDAESDVLFLDGDRFPVIGDLSDLSTIDEDVASIMLEDDFRHKEDFPNMYGSYFNWVYSAGIFFKRSAIDRIVDFQGTLFNEALQEKWGIEDTTLGDVCHHLGLTATLIDSIRLNGHFNNNIVDIEACKKRAAFNKKIGHRFKINLQWTNGSVETK